MVAAQLARDEQTFYLYVSSPRKSIFDTRTVFYRVVGEQLASTLCRLLGKEYSPKSGNPGFFLRPSADVDPDDQILLDEALVWIDMYDDPDPGVYDEPPSEDEMIRAQYARRARGWEVLIGNRKSPQIGSRIEESANEIVNDSLSWRAQRDTEDQRSSLEASTVPVDAIIGSALPVKPRAKRGPKPKMKFHGKVAEVVNSFGFRANWKELPNLERIAERMDKRKIPALSAWAKREPRALTWGRAVSNYPDAVRKAIEYSLVMAARDKTEKPSETFGNLR